MTFTIMTSSQGFFIFLVQVVFSLPPNWKFKVTTDNNFTYEWNLYLKYLFILFKMPVFCSKSKSHSLKGKLTGFVNNAKLIRIKSKKIEQL